ncbi:sulfotransferase [Candidatus Marimicrobium litorale]|uniref:Sulfotransferase n=1 Tax=Candidatus Marimicrobium litorale TaxID=2518991 RepID=A0ABT3T8Z6_9GAMM|nr:sulfotransferase [Candidatus Marimicrobium litorale]MCX2978645.1 sulfotransferase [Candidatus Marimicrobium litorale]
MAHPDYGPFEKLLHRLALGPSFLRQATFDVQDMALRKEASREIVAPVFIAGLARSGSTILLNTLHETGAFRSLTYRDMPFVLMPGVWSGMSRASRRQGQAQERAHGDRLMVEYDSPEAFEEVFWRTFAGVDYVQPNAVIAHAPSAEARRNFPKFIRHVLASDPAPVARRYLSKNNNNLLRLPTLRSIFPNAHILIPFRSPLQHALSLLRQHKKFCQIHNEDRFSMQYMDWLGHWEFGLQHKQYRFSDERGVWRPDDVNYWLHTWLGAHQYAIERDTEQPLYLCYETICESEGAILNALFARLGVTVEENVNGKIYQAAEQREHSAVDPELLARCESVYAELQAIQFRA